MAAMEKNNKTLNVPNLRFTEFSGEWEKCKIKQVCDIATGNKNTQDKSDDGIYPFYVRSQTVERINSWSFDGEAILTAGDGVGVGKVFHYSTGKIGVHQRVYILSNFTCDSKYLFHYFSSRFYGRVKRMSAKNSVDSVRMEMIADMPIYLASNDEQHKIGNLMSLLNERIETQKKIIEDLKKLKDAIAEKLFCCPDDESPELRVENSSDRWNLYRLKDVCQRITERNSQKSSSLVLTIAAQYGLVSQTDFFNKSVASENLSNYYLIRKGDFAYNKSYSGEYAWGAVKRLELYEKGVLSPLYICFRPNPLIVYSDFLSHYFETHKWHNGIAQIAGEGARNHGLLNISISDFFETIHRFPELPEQQRIASYLNSLSDKISLANKVLESYTRQKRYLLARMFI